MTMELFPECQICVHFTLHGTPNEKGVLPVPDGRCECTKHGRELPYIPAKLLICLDYENRVGERARDWKYEPLREGILYSYDSGYNFRESFGPVCPLNALPQWVDKS